MATKLADVFINVIVKADDLERSLGQAERKTSAFANTIQGVFQGVGQRLFDAVTAGVSRAVGEINKAIQASSNLNESINKATVVFGENAQAILEWSQTSATAFGQSQQQALEAASSFGNLFRSIGLTTDKSAEMSQALVELAGDLASFNNISPDEALIKLRAGIVGETEPLRTLGVNLSAVAVEAEGVRLGLAATGDELSEQDKIIARYNIILRQTALAQGDFARTASSAANAQRILGAQLENGAARLGNIFRPAYEAIINQLVNIAPTVFNYAVNIADSFAQGLATLIDKILPILLIVRDVFAYWLRPGSPPKLLPDLTKWGLGAMQAYLDGFLDADIKGALDEVGRAISDILRSFVGTGELKQGDVVQRVLGGRQAIANAVKEFKTLGRVSSETMAAIVRAAGPAGASVAALVRSYFDLESASKDAASAQDELNRITDEYAKLIDPLQSKLSANDSAQQAIRDELRLAELRSDIADSTLEQERAIAAQQEIAAIRQRQAAGGGNWTERVADQERLVELEKQLKEASTATQRTELARLQIDEIRLRQQLANVEAQKESEQDAAQRRLDEAKKAQEAAQQQLNNAQAIIDLQKERNDLIAEQIRLAKEAEQAQLDAIQKIKDEQEKARKEAEDAANKAQRDQAAVDDAQFDFQFATADTAGKLALLQKKLGETDQGTVDYYRTLTQIAQVQQQYNDELERAAKQQDEASKEAERAADAQFDYQLSIADTSGQLELLRGKLAQTTEGSAEYYQTLTQIASLEKQYQQQIKQATDAQFAYQLAIADTPEKIALLEQALADTTEGSAEYYNILTQISGLEKQRQNELDGLAKQQESAAQQATDAQFQYQLALADTAGKIDLLKEKLASQQQGSAEYYQTLTQIQSLESQLADEQKRAAEQSADAFFSYQLAVSDTAGQLELLKGKLAGLTPGTAEYYQTLTQIAQTQERLNKELDKSGPAYGAAADAATAAKTPVFEMTEGTKHLAESVDNLFKAWNTPSAELPDWIKSLVDAFRPDGAVPKAFQAVVEAVKELSRVIEERFPKLKRDTEETAGALEKLWQKHGETVLALWNLLWSDIAAAFEFGVNTVFAAFTAFTGLITGNWERFTEGLKTIWNGFVEFWWTLTSNEAERIRLFFDTFFPGLLEQWRAGIQNIVDSVTSFGQTLYNGAVNLATQFWDGLKSKWSEIETWWTQNLQWLRNQLPFSEPKDPSSPLRGLSKSGAAIVEMIQVGIQSASADITPLAERLLTKPTGLGGFAASTGAGDVTIQFGDIVVNGSADPAEVRRAVAGGADDIVKQLRQRGL